MAMSDEERKERAREATRRWRAKNPERANEIARANQKKWRAENPEKHRERAKKWKDENYDRFLERHTEWRHTNRDHINRYRMKQYYKAKYGLTIEERDAMLVAQGGCCKICGVTQPGNKIGWVVDHCHNSEKVRGILCHDCNLALGHVKDNTDILRRMIAYLGAESG